MADKTWVDVKGFINRMLPAEAVMVDDAYVDLINIAIDKTNEASGGFNGYWTNIPDTDTGTLVLSGNACTFPADLLEARVIHWATNPIYYRTEAQLERMDPAWRTRSGVPSYYSLTARGFQLDCDPGNDTGGPLEVWGSGCIPHLDLGPGSPNPFAYLSQPGQMAPAFYVLGFMPLFGRGGEETVRIQTDYRQQWERFLENTAWNTIVRKFPRMSS